jgi:hypothetical protein
MTFRLIFSLGDLGHEFRSRVAMEATGNWMIGEAGGRDKVPATFKTAFALFPKNAPADPSGYVKNPDMIDKDSLINVLQNTKAAAMNIPQRFRRLSTQINNLRFMVQSKERIYSL